MRSVYVFSGLLIIFFISCKEQKQGRPSDAQIKEQKIISKSDVFINVFQNKQDNSSLDTILSNEYVRNLNGIEVASNKEELKASLNVYYIGFPDLELTNQFRLVKENQVFLQWIITGTNTGVFGETPATGKKIKISGFSHFYFNDDGKMYQEDIYYNELDLLQQLGYQLTPPVVE